MINHDNDELTGLTMINVNHDQPPVLVMVMLITIATVVAPASWKLACHQWFGAYGVYSFI